MTAMKHVDQALLQSWQPWLGNALKRFTSSGFAETARTMSMDTVRALVASPDLLYSAAIDRGDQGHGLIILTHARWEARAIHRPVAKVTLLAADSYEIALELARSALVAAKEAGMVLVSFAAGHSPTFIHVAVNDAGFHLGSQALTIRADLNAIAPAVARIPLRGTFRPATRDDAGAVATIAQRGFSSSRYTADPHFPAEWGGMLYAAWARQLVLGAADIVIVAEHADKIIGFVSMCMDDARRAQAPDLMAVEPRYEGFGLGVLLVRHMLDWYREQGMKVMTGKTEKNNVAINALWARLGVLFRDSNIVYHASPALSPLREQLP